MDFEGFAEKMAGLINEKTDGRYEAGVERIRKNNDTGKTGLVLKEGGKKIHPVIYLEGYYRKYQAGADIRGLAEELVSVYGMMGLDLDMEFFRDFKKVQDRIYIRLVNYEKNGRLLEELPHVRWLDLAMVFYYSMVLPDGERASVTIRNLHLDMWGETEENVRLAAGRNMEKDMQGQLLPMRDVLMQLTGIDPGQKEPLIYILTNREKYYGASAVLYSRKLKGLAEEMGSDLLILPSSVHELLILRDSHKMEYDAYRQMVKEINASVVEPQEVLSDNLYRYSREKDAVEMIAV